MGRNDSAKSIVLFAVRKIVKITNKKIVKLLSCLIVEVKKNNISIQQYNNYKFPKGFTLIELLVVIGVIGVLATSLIILIDPVTQLRRARDATRKSDLSQISAALEFYRSDLGSYREQSNNPDHFADPSSGILGCGVSLTGGTPPNTYMLKAPCDPLNPTSTYFYNATGATPSTYIMWACLENINDIDRDCDDNSGACDRCPAVGRVSYTLQNP